MAPAKVIFYLIKVTFNFFSCERRVWPYFNAKCKNLRNYCDVCPKIFMVYVFASGCISH